MLTRWMLRFWMRLLTRSSHCLLLPRPISAILTLMTLRLTSAPLIALHILQVLQWMEQRG